MTPAEVVSEVLKSIVGKVRVGVNLLELERAAENTILLLGAESANKGYLPGWASVPYPSVVCLGVNDDVAHTIPRNYDLRDGDLLHIDCGVKIHGLAGDAGLSVPVGNISRADDRLLRVAKRILYEGIRAARPGVKVTDVGKAIELYASRMGYVTNVTLHGHDIGREMHKSFSIPNFNPQPVEVKKRVNGRDRYEYKALENVPVLEEGTVVCIEPHVTYRDRFGYKTADGWGIKTRDGKRSAFFEHMVRVAGAGPEILTSHINEGG